MLDSHRNLTFVEFLFFVSDEMAIIEKLAEVSAEYVGKHAYIGMQTTVGPKTMIGDSAVILEAVVIPSHVIVLATEIVARTPTSLYFYRQCHDFILTDKCVQWIPMTIANPFKQSYV